MAAFRLVRTRDGLLLMTGRPVSDQQLHHIRNAFLQWKAEAPDGLLVVPDGEYVEIDLPVEFGGPSLTSSLEQAPADVESAAIHHLMEGLAG